jgi:type I restriction enzyme, R subunit
MEPNQIRKIIRTLRDSLPEIFPGRTEVVKTIIFAKNDSSADEIIQTVRAEFAEGNDFCQKLIYGATENPKTILADFCNLFNPRIVVVTVEQK